ncbi:MAG TPA: AAA family ATPase [Gemmatimonadaceae bacterium]|jgi:para-aminobenzoate synthetase
MNDKLLSRVGHMLNACKTPIVIAFDGPSGSGKSTLARELAAHTVATIVPTDDFFSAKLSAADWDVRSAAERARDALDWQRLRQLALEPLRAGRPGMWYPFDFAAGERPDGSYPMCATAARREPAPLVILEGAYSARPELADLIDLAVLIDAPAPVRHQRLAAREQQDFLEAWHRRWDGAEAFYFTEVRPPESFDLVIDTA